MGSDGNVHSLLVHGARAVLGSVHRRQRAERDGAYPWLELLLAHGHVNRVTVTLANKTARAV